MTVATILLLALGLTLGHASGLAFSIYRETRRHERWLEEFTKFKKAETAEFIRRLEDQ
jgi:hypothetical protein